MSKRVKEKMDVSMNKQMNVDSKKNAEAAEAAPSGRSARDISLDKLKALLLSKAELILSTISDSILAPLATNNGQFFVVLLR